MQPRREKEMTGEAAVVVSLPEGEREQRQDSSED